MLDHQSTPACQRPTDTRNTRGAHARRAPRTRVREHAHACLTRRHAERNDLRHLTGLDLPVVAQESERTNMSYICENDVNEKNPTDRFKVFYARYTT